MNFVRKRNVKYFYLILAIFLQCYNLTDAINCIQCGLNENDKCPSDVSALTLKDCGDNSVTKCFTKIDNKGVVSRGCLKSDDTSCKAEENCVTSEDGKNNQIICKTCVGADENCSQTDMSSNDIKYNKICDQGIKKCLVKVDDKLVTRGCASDTEKCNDSNTCKLCDTDKCNAGIFPSERIQCYHCNGTTCNDVTANSLTPKPCLNYVQKDECYTKGENDTTMIRGCKSDTKDNQCSSAANGCAFCSADNCNNLKYKHDQTLKCYQCTGESIESDCFKEQTNKEYKNCEQQILYSDAEYCYSSVKGETIKRGCLHDNKDLSVDKCTGNDNDSCTKCNTGDGCNSAKKNAEEFTCIVCRSDLNKLCWDEAQKIPGQKCHTGVGSAQDGCFYGVWNGTAIRGCTIDASAEVQEVCKDKDNKQCHICNTINCNTDKTIGTDVINCIQCGLNENDKCPDVSALTPKACGDNSFTKCFTKIDNKGVVSRGCLKSDDTSCKAEENCVTSENGKNNQIICKTCVGADKNCSQTDMNSNDIKYNKICDQGIKKCLVKVDDKLVTRGCASDTEKCNDSNTCKLCDTDKCNAGIFPTKRIQCYHCNGTTCNDVTANSLTPKPCLNYVQKDECYTKGENDTTMIRGCKSDTKDNQCSSSASGCAFCSADNCNNLKYKHDQTLKCYQCTGDDIESDCFKEQTNKEYKNCEQQILYSDAEYCYSSVNGETIKRGCLHDNKDLSVDKCTGNDNDYCTKCNTGDGCNSAKKNAEEFTCIVCRSDLNKLCWNEAQKIPVKKCRTGVSSSKDGCFHGVWNDIAIRGCTIDASAQVQEVCKDKNNKQCRICYAKNCNTDKTSGAGKLTLNLAFLLIVFTAMCNFK